MEKREKTQREHQEDAALHKLLFWIVGTALMTVLLRWLHGAYINFETTEGAINLAWSIGQALPYVCGAGILAGAALLFWALRMQKAGKGNPLFCALGLFLGGVGVCAGMVYGFGAGGLQLVTYVVIGLAVLAMLYYLYQRDFVLVGFACGLGLAGVWLFFRMGNTTRGYVAVFGLVALLAVLAIASYLLQKKGGLLKIKGGDVELLPRGANYTLIYLTCAIMVVLLVAALLAGGLLNVMVFYAVPVAWLLVMAVYYTVKLM